MRRSKEYEQEKKYYKCIKCKQIWNVPNATEFKRKTYTCPYCEYLRRKNEN